MIELEIEKGYYFLHFRNGNGFLIKKEDVKRVKNSKFYQLLESSRVEVGGYFSDWQETSFYNKDGEEITEKIIETAKEELGLEIGTYDLWQRSKIFEKYAILKTETERVIDSIESLLRLKDERQYQVLGEEIKSPYGLGMIKSEINLETGKHVERGLQKDYSLNEILSFFKKYINYKK